MATLARRLNEIGALADRVADKYDEDRDVVDLADRHVTGLLKGLNGVLALHKEMKVWEYDDVNGVWVYDEHGEKVPLPSICQECTPHDTLLAIEDCEWTEDYESVEHPCPTVRLLDAAIRTTEPDAQDTMGAQAREESARSARAIASLRERLTAPARYSQCDSTCTTDCGHCKGNGRPDELDRLVTAVDAARDDHQRERAALGGVA